MSCFYPLTESGACREVCIHATIPWTSQNLSSLSEQGRRTKCDDISASSIKFLPDFEAIF